MSISLPLLTLLPQFGYPDMDFHSRLDHPGHNSGFGASVAVLGDLDGDAWSDFAVSSTEYAGQDVYVYSGATRALLYRLTARIGIGEVGARVIAGMNDLDGDLAPEIVVREASVVSCFSGATGAMIWSRTLSAPEMYSVAVTSDHNGDGVQEVLTCEYEMGVMLSGADGSTLFQYPRPASFSSGFGGAIDGSGDGNADGIADVIIGRVPHNVALFDGATGALIRTHEGPSEGSLSGRRLTWIRDVTTDGADDYALVKDSTYLGGDRVQVYSGRTGGERMYIYPPGGSITHVAEVGDWDDDGRPELGICGDNFSAYSLPATTLHWDVPDIGEVVTSFAGPADANADSFEDILIGYANRAGTSSSDLGRAELWYGSTNPILTADTSTVSASAGGIVNFEADFLPEQHYFDYQVLASTVPGVSTVGGMVIPLQDSAMLRWTMRGIYPAAAYRFTGLLGGSGDASMKLEFLPNEMLAWVGSTVWLACVSGDRAYSGYIRERGHCSVAVPITFLP